MAKLIETSKLAIISMAIALLSGCANDLIIDLGKGNEVRLVGHAGDFDCADPAYANVNKVTTFHLVFVDGTKTLCRDADLPPPVMPAEARSAPAAISAGSIQTRPLPAGHSGARRSAFGDVN